ncbi:hypothetical protein FRE64_16805 (plasmid) [Euhalothece natronophila Z-M001]|uniref:Uncharacterized protein n=1 Tax=Euhalothece natronophila Z-M001 TaxID=522448 RepID=A0A5B8NUB9_9CHRO|nr:hypothetical protein [Euhalothece natronophila]QDZ41630.1 hypothetical protein FRE64_16805 [Euhalothece natronophila Z-M001]
MRIIQTKGIIKDGDLSVSLPEDIKNGEVDVIVVSSKQPDEYESRHQMMKEKGYDTPEKVRDLIHQVKLEMLKEKGEGSEHFLKTVFFRY